MTPELEDYILDHIEPEPDDLATLDRLTNLRLMNGRMCSGHLQGRLLKMLTVMIRPRRVLELGAFSGYSALCLAEGLAETGDRTGNGDGNPEEVVSVEADDELEDFIRDALARSPYGNLVRLVIADARQWLAGTPDESFDLIFIDADKRQYPDYLREAARIVTKGGYIIADNTLWDGHVAEPGRRDPQTEGVRVFNDLAATMPQFETVIVPVRDGLTLMRRKY